MFIKFFCALVLFSPGVLFADYFLTKIGERNGDLAFTEPSSAIVGNGDTAYWHDYGSTNADGGGERILYFPGGVFAADPRTLSEAGDFPVGRPMDTQNGKLLVQGRYFEPAVPQGYNIHNTLTEYPGPVRLLYPFSAFPDGIPSSGNIQIGSGFYDNDGTIVFFFRQVQSPQIVFTAIGRLSGGSVTVLVRSGVTQMPGVTNTFTKIGRHSTQGGVTFFYGEGNGKRGVYQLSGGGVSKVLESGDPIPSGQAGTVTILSESNLGLANEASDIAIAISDLSGAVYKRMGGVWSRVAKPGDTIPHGVGNFFSLKEPAIHGGKVMFYGERDNQFSPPLQLGLYVETASGVESVVDLNSDFEGMSVRYLVVPDAGGRYWDGEKVVFTVFNQAHDWRAIYLAKPALRISSFDLSGGGGTPRLTFQTVVSVNYRIEGSSNLLNWTTVSNFVGDGAEKTVGNLPSGGSAGFFRVASP